jgi:hypothetical protein
MADPLPWPSVLMPSSEDWSLRGGTRSGGQTFQGNEQIVASPTARWKASLTIPCFKRAQILEMRRVIALGRSQVWYVGPYERGRAPWPYEPIIGGLISDRTPGLSQPPIQISLGAESPVNTAVLTPNRASGGLLVPGMLFSINGRLHMITKLNSGNPVAAGSGLAAPGLIEVEIRPWLREGWPEGTPMEFATPLSTMRLASDDTGAMELQLSRYGTVTLELVEAF